MEKENYAIEWNGENWQSVFPSRESDKSMLHSTKKDALDYMTRELGIPRNEIEIIKQSK